MDNRYFTPAIEDLRVSYVCEHTSDRSAFTINATGDIITGELSTRDIIEIICWVIEDGEDLCCFVRVPYLTREQIELCGWELIHKHQFDDINFDDNNFKPHFKYGFEKGNYMMGFCTRDSAYEMIIIIKDPAHKDIKFIGAGHFHLMCDCRDINTLKAIEKIFMV